MHEIKVLLQAIEDLRPNLPALVGKHWPQLARDLGAYLEQLEETPTTHPSCVPRHWRSLATSPKRIDA
jgi:hypothetical protein